MGVPFHGELTPVKTIHLLRHAKSSWSDTGVADHDRPLAPRGQRDARRLAKHLGQHGVAPALVLCSSARRSRDTLELIARSLPRKTKILVEDELYAAPAEALLQRLGWIPDVLPSALLIGHNPGLQDLALTLAGHGPGLDRLRESFPTCALVAMHIPAPTWRELVPGTAELIDYVIPGDL
jgi:phosphohistidine phosphatase